MILNNKGAVLASCAVLDAQVVFWCFKLRLSSLGLFLSSSHVFFSPNLQKQAKLGLTMFSYSMSSPPPVPCPLGIQNPSPKLNLVKS
jgi:hypothetical protein